MVSLLTSAATGADVWVQWKANQELGLAGYYLHHGPASRGYTNRIEVGLTTNCMLELSGRQFIAISAFNYLGWESELSQELVYEPLHLVTERSVDGVLWEATRTNEVRALSALEFFRLRIER
jgi:hypothetical protein